MDNDIIIGDIITNLNVTIRTNKETLTLMQRLKDLNSNADAFNALVSVQRELNDVLDYFKANS